MLKMRWLLALPLVMAASIGSAQASSIRDNAGMFSREAVRQAQSTLDAIERSSQLNVNVETIDSLEGDSIDNVSLRHAKRLGGEGLFILVAKKEHKIDVRSSTHYSRAFPAERRQTIQQSFINEFKRGSFDQGLIKGTETLESEVVAAKGENGGVLRSGGIAPGRRAPAPMRPGQRQGTGLGGLLFLGLGIIAFLFVIRMIGRLFSGGQGYGYGGPGRMAGGPGGYGAPGYGAPGYGGGGGGGFLSSMFGGIGGALAGNWLYDQFSGRHHQTGYTDSSSYGDGNQGYAEPSGGDDWSGGGNTSGDWGGDSGGGGDWGGGGGGDWGGGDSGGGGGDW